MEKLHYTTEEVKEILSVSDRTLNEWACQRKGPPFRKPGKYRLYPIKPFHQWTENLPLFGGTNA